METDSHWNYSYQKPLLSEVDWVAAGVMLTPGWEHYFVFHPEPHVLLFRRVLVV